MNKADAVNIIEVDEKLPLFKGDILADKVELIRLKNIGFDIVAQKGLYNKGEDVIYIQPDYCLPDTSLFGSYIRPNGDESKSMLGKIEGKPRRIRAKKFNLSLSPNGDPIYSNGILLPYDEVYSYLYPVSSRPPDLEDKNLTELLGITKYEEPEYNTKNGLKLGQLAGKFPESVYKTDEENIHNLWNHIENKIGYPVTLVGTEKIDGSSITIGVIPKIPEGFICSRNFRKKLTINKVVDRREPNFWEIIKSWFGIKPDLNIYQEMENDDDFVKYGKPYLKILLNNTTQYLVLRGELNGGKLKGSGNKNNPASKEPANIKLFGIDKVNEYNEAEKMPYRQFKLAAEHLGFPTVKEVFVKEFNSKEELLAECNNYFKQNMVEGIVVRTLDSKFSAKVMNSQYDSLK